MRTLPLVTALAGLLVAATVMPFILRAEPSRAGDPPTRAGVDNRPFPQLSVSATVDVRVAPDEVWLHLGVESFKPTLREAVADTDQRMAAALKVLKDGGVAADDIATEYVWLTASSQYDKTRGGDIHGFQATRRFVARVRRIETVELLLKGALEAGVTNVYNVNFTNTGIAKFKEEARNRAVVEARAKAQGMAAAIGQSIGRAVALSDGTVSPWAAGAGGVQTGFTNANYANDVLNGGGPGFQGNALAAGRIQVSITITATFELI